MEEIIHEYRDRVKLMAGLLLRLDQEGSSPALTEEMTAAAHQSVRCSLLCNPYIPFCLDQATIGLNQHGAYKEPLRFMLDIQSDLRPAGHCEPASWAMCVILPMLSQ